MALSETTTAPRRRASGAAARRAHPAVPRSALAVLTVAALGVVFGDIGTSPLYALQIVYSLNGGVAHPSVRRSHGRL